MTLSYWRNIRTTLSIYVVNCITFKPKASEMLSWWKSFLIFTAGGPLVLEYYVIDIHGQIIMSANDV